MALKIESLYYFMVLAETGSFTAAAEKLYMSQQALSNQIAQLEKSLGKILIQRSPGKVHSLTTAGQQLQLESQPLLSRMQALEKNNLAVTESEQPEICLRIGSILVLDAKIAQILHHWSQTEAHFRVQLTLPVAGPEQIEKQLLNQELDLGVLIDPPTQTGLAFQALAPEPYLIVGRAGLQAEWQTLQYISYISNSESQDHLLNRWPEKQWPRQIVAHADIAMALEIAQYSDFCLHIPRHFIDFESLSEICKPPFRTDFTPCLVWATAKTLPPVLEKLKLEIIQRLHSTPSSPFQVGS